MRRFSAIKTQALGYSSLSFMYPPLPCCHGGMSVMNVKVTLRLSAGALRQELHVFI